MESVVKDMGLGLLRQFLVARALSERLMGFCGDEGVTDVAARLGLFDLRRWFEGLAAGPGYRLDTPVRRRMAATLLDFLVECGVVERGPEGTYRYAGKSGATAGEEPLSGEERETLRRWFAGEIDFFDACLDEAPRFLRGGPHPFDFTDECLALWEGFLGNFEFGTLRAVMLRLMAVDDAPSTRVLDLCFGLGHGIVDLMSDFRDASITAVDFSDTYRPAAEARVEEAARRRGIEIDGRLSWAEGWKGFGEPLPFGDAAFDAVHFTFSDPYIPAQLRRSVYGEIRRVLKPGGVLGAATWVYPDDERQVVSNRWIRRQVLVHDFAESVCRGWQGFHDAGLTLRLFDEIGFERKRSLFGDDNRLGSSLWVMVRR
ncbi:MAG TPA: class I SAM-dependent methyltransferase [Deltaproteobacteria bacterium]|nr:class I SAM-dependent methyltransferase [Deltaproteobacteria bacterium]